MVSITVLAPFLSKLSKIHSDQIFVVVVDFQLMHTSSSCRLLFTSFESSSFLISAALLKAIVLISLHSGKFLWWTTPNFSNTLRYSLRQNIESTSSNYETSHVDPT